MNTTVTTSGMITSALLAASVFASEPATAGIKSSYAGETRALSDVGKSRRPTEAYCRKFVCSGMREAGGPTDRSGSPLSGSVDDSGKSPVAPRRQQAFPVKSRRTLSTATDARP